MSKLKQIITPVCFAFICASCVAAPAPVYDLSTQPQTLSEPRAPEPAPALANRINNNETDMERLNRLVNSGARLQIALQQQVDQLAQDINNLRGQLEKSQYDKQQLEERQKELFLEIDKLRTQLNSGMSAAQTNTSANKKANEGVYSTNDNEKTAYQKAVDLILNDRNYDGAIKDFEHFLTQYPQSVYVPNARYWLGQLYLAKKEDVKAAENFGAVLKYKASSKRGDALLKLGDIAKRNKQIDKANHFYQQVINEYPNTPSAKLAAEKL